MDHSKPADGLGHGRLPSRGRVPLLMQAASPRARAHRMGVVLVLCCVALLVSAVVPPSPAMRPASVRAFPNAHRGAAVATPTPRVVPAARAAPGAAPAAPRVPDSITAALTQDIAGMTLDEELGQLFIAEFTGTDFNASNATMVAQLHAGGIILYSVSIQSAAQTRALIASAQAHASMPLLVALDEEGGWVDRLQQLDGSRPSATQIGATGSTSYAYQQGERVARDMAALGFNLDLAPDVDVQLVAGPDQLTRTFGATPGTVITMAGAFLAGLQSQPGVAGTLKHFPGLGAATSDAHKDLPVINRTRAQIEAVELAPYRALIASGQAQVIMATDVLMPALDPNLPAELSPAIMTGVLRNELGFNGVVVTDALYMAGVADTYGMPQAAVMAIAAGDDLLLGPWTPEQMGPMIDALRTAVQNGTLSKARIDQSVRRILLLKMRMGLLPLPSATAHAINQTDVSAWAQR